MIPKVAVGLALRHPLVVSWDEKIVCAMSALFGAGLGFAIYLIGLGSFRNGPAEWWNGGGAMAICVGIGGFAGVPSYVHRHKEVSVELPSEGPYKGMVGGYLFVRRLGVIAVAIVAIYFMWQLAKSI